jgi:hypothetical protein
MLLLSSLLVWFPVPHLAGVAAWRSWLTKFGAEMPLLPKKLEDLPPLMSRRESLDRLSQHTEHCPDCQQVRSCIGCKGCTSCTWRDHVQLLSV